jgi:stage II sporulation protein D
VRLWLPLIATLLACRTPERLPTPVATGASSEASSAPSSPDDAGATGPFFDSGVAVATDPPQAPDAGKSGLDLSALPLPPRPDDELGFLYSKRLDFRHGNPAVPIRVTEGVTEIRFSPRGRMRMKIRGALEKQVEAPPGSWWTVRVVRGTPAQLIPRLQLAELAYADKRGLAREQKLWSDRGVKLKVQTLGGVYGVGGNVIDNRRQRLMLEEPLDAVTAPGRQAELRERFGAQAVLVEEIGQRPSGVLELLDSNGASIALGEDWMGAEGQDGAGFDVKQVEFGMGYDFHGFEDRAFRGSLQFTVDRGGKLAVLNVVTLEELLLGLVPSEIFARAHPEALKAQAVTARAEVLAKVGTKHLTDPYLLCPEQHCAVYRGLGQEAPTTNAAVQATQGEGLFAADGKLVDSVYSAVCGGHTENNDVVWGGIPNPSLRGKPDLIGPAPKAPKPTQDLGKYLAANLPVACRMSSFAQPTKYRWEKRFTAEEVNALVEPLGLGRVQGMSVDERGVSGRATLLTLSGEHKATQLRGELNIRRFFKMLNSSMFLISPERGPEGQVTHWLFRGGGWGHGVGLCQTGAIGRAEAGQGYKQILRHYFNGAHVARIY